MELTVSIATIFPRHEAVIGSESYRTRWSRPTQRPISCSVAFHGNRNLVGRPSSWGDTKGGPIPSTPSVWLEPNTKPKGVYHVGAKSVCPKRSLKETTIVLAKICFISAYLYRIICFE